MAERIVAGYRVSKLRAVVASSRPRAMDNILEALEKCVASMTTGQVSLPSHLCARYACPALLLSTVRSASAARSLTQRDEGDLHSW